MENLICTFDFSIGTASLKNDSVQSYEKIKLRKKGNQNLAQF